MIFKRGADIIDLKDKYYFPDLEEVGMYIGNPVFMDFCAEVKAKYKCREKLDFSSCSWEKGRNIKFKKSGKTLCTVYPGEGYFTVMIVIGRKEKAAVEERLTDCTAELQNIYSETKEGNGQKWLMFDLVDKGQMYDDIFRLIEIRR